jgi:hypothetical protein
MRGRLRWFGHVERKDRSDLVSAFRELEVEGMRGRGRGRKMWGECVRDDMKGLGLRKEDAQDRVNLYTQSVTSRGTCPFRSYLREPRVHDVPLHLRFYLRNWR